MATDNTTVNMLLREVQMTMLANLIYDWLYLQAIQTCDYQLLTRWCWQWLGKDVHVVIPSCAVTKLSAFPSTGGEYTGFKS